MQGLRITMFGSLQLARGARSATPEGAGGAGARQALCHCGRPAQTLLAYLLLHRNRLHRREALAGLLWGETSEERARGALRTALWRLRRVLEPAGAQGARYLVTTPRGELGFRVRADVWVDVARFEDAVAEALAGRPQTLEADGAARLEAALRLYEGELLEGFYDDWVLRERERLRALYLDALGCLMRSAAGRGDLDAAIGHGRRLLAEDPLRESIHREVMRLHLRNGQRAEAVRQYAECRRILDADLQVEPMPETTVLYQEIVGGNSLPDDRGASSLRLQQAMDDLQKAFVQVRRAQDELERAIKSVTALGDGREPS